MMKLETWLKLNAFKLVITGFNTAYEWSLTWTIIYSVHVHMHAYLAVTIVHSKALQIAICLGTQVLPLFTVVWDFMLTWETMKVLRNGIQVVMITLRIPLTSSSSQMRFTIVFISRKFQMTFSAHRLDLMKEVTQSNGKYAHNHTSA